MAAGIHHTVVIVRDLDASLRFYRDGIGPRGAGRPVGRGRLARACSTLPAVASGRCSSATRRSRTTRRACSSSTCSTAMSLPAQPPGPPGTGFFLMSFFVDVEATLGRLAELGLGGEPRRVDAADPDGAISLATVRDPDGVTGPAHPRLDHPAHLTTAAHREPVSIRIGRQGNHSVCNEGTQAGGPGGMTGATGVKTTVLPVVRTRHGLGGWIDTTTRLGSWNRPAGHTTVSIVTRPPAVAIEVRA